MGSAFSLSLSLPGKRCGLVPPHPARERAPAAFFSFAGAQALSPSLSLSLSSTQPEEGRAAPSPAHECALLVLGLHYTCTLRPEVVIRHTPLVNPSPRPHLLRLVPALCCRLLFQSLTTVYCSVLPPQQKRLQHANMTLSLSLCLPSGCQQQK